jgi:sugar phosphate isomerase/epimerase
MARHRCRPLLLLASIAVLVTTDAQTAAGAGTGVRTGAALAATGHVDLVGDSVTEQAFGYLGGEVGTGAPRHLDRWSGTGWTVADVAAHTEARAEDGGLDALVVALGPNDASPTNGGWDATDVARWRRLLATPAASACVVVVLPGWGQQLDGTPWAKAMERMRADVRGLAAAREAAGSPTVTVDWLPIVRRHPDYLAGDGIHLGSDAAAAARQQLYWQGLDHCA